MDFKDYYKQLAERVSKLKEQTQTEEATKNAFIMPFIQMLGYDVFDPLEVVPEMDCDLIKKKGEKIDYAIMKNGDPIMLVECKHWQQDLKLHDTQLQKYFVASKAKFGVLTNGVKYRFYTDLVKPNIMDDVPFLEIDFEDVKEAQIEEVKKFHKSYFDVNNILTSASELKYMSELKTAVQTEFTTPSPEFVKLFTKKVYYGAVTQKVIDQFTDLIKRSINTHINDVMSERLNMAIKTTEPAQASNIEEKTKLQETSNNVPLIETTDEELEGFYIVKSILRNYTASERITYRDAQSYLAIFLDDNNRKPLCRLYFNSATKYIGIVDETKKDIRHKIENLDEIYNYAETLIKTAQIYLCK